MTHRNVVVFILANLAMFSLYSLNLDSSDFDLLVLTIADVIMRYSAGKTVIHDVTSVNLNINNFYAVHPPTLLFLRRSRKIL